MVTAFYEVVLLVAKNKKAHTIAKTLISSVAKSLVGYVDGEKTVAKVNSMSLSNDPMNRGIM